MRGPLRVGAQVAAGTYLDALAAAFASRAIEDEIGAGGEGGLAAVGGGVAEHPAVLAAEAVAAGQAA